MQVIYGKCMYSLVDFIHIYTASPDFFYKWEVHTDFYEAFWKSDFNLGRYIPSCLLQPKEVI